MGLFLFDLFSNGIKTYPINYAHSYDNFLNWPKYSLKGHHNLLSKLENFLVNDFHANLNVVQKGHYNLFSKLENFLVDDFHAITW